MNELSNMPTPSGELGSWTDNKIALSKKRGLPPKRIVQENAATAMHQKLMEGMAEELIEQEAEFRAMMWVKAREKLVDKFGEDVVYKLESGESVTLDKSEMIAVTNEARSEIISELMSIIESDERLAGDFLDQMQGDGRVDFLASVGRELIKIFKM